ncbi:YybH family protein [Lactococcus lactis]|uniref:Ketosteroid isomerase-like protein n=1 Tax=Lactococcus lactis subsp. lactis TaxID=1360 RepID=A0A0V8E314_LACLL|nr:nuclear transport factor 2 family protein [Lactococcus lactis]KSU20190.1 Ketosteroid isomerase-like protein [Lactococcus lactis subsp. lactis]
MQNVDLIKNEIKTVIDTCDKLIHEEKFDELVNFYTEDATLVIKPGMNANGREQIKSAFIKIASYFDNSIKPVEGKMIYLVAGDTVLVLAQTFLEANQTATDNSEFSMERRATYVFRKIDEKWLCAIDNSYGTSLVD